MRIIQGGKACLSLALLIMFGSKVVDAETVQPTSHASGFSWVINLFPSSNINRGSNSSELDTVLGSFQIASYSRGRPGVSADVGAQGFTAYQVNPKAQTVVNWGLTSRLYEDLGASTFAGRLGVKYQTQIGKSVFSFGPSLFKTQNQLQSTIDSLRWSVHAARQVSGVDQLSLRFSENHDTYSSDSYLNGAKQTYNFGWTRALSDNRAFRLELVTNVARPQALHQQYDTASMGLNYAWVHMKRWKVNIGSTLGIRQFVGIYPLHAEARADQFFDLGIKMQDGIWKVFGSHPTVGCKYTYNSSNINLYDFDAFDCNFSFSL